MRILLLFGLSLLWLACTTNGSTIIPPDTPIPTVPSVQIASTATTAPTPAAQATPTGSPAIMPDSQPTGLSTSTPTRAPTTAPYSTANPYTGSDTKVLSLPQRRRWLQPAHRFHPRFPPLLLCQPQRPGRHLRGAPHQPLPLRPYRGVRTCTKLCRCRSIWRIHGGTGA